MKLGLILEGGASRTFFSCGVLDVLLEENIIADYVIGTSAGIANAVSYVSGQTGRNLQIAKKYLHDKRYMGFHHMLKSNNRSFYNLNFVFDELPNKQLPFDYKAFAEFKGNVVAVVTNVNSGKVEYLEMPRDDKTFQTLRASCALPILFPIIKIDGKRYMDGGICVPIPVDEAIRSGCDKNIIILTQERGYRKLPERNLVLASKLYKKYPNFAKALLARTEMYNKNLEHLEKLEKDGKVFVIAPDKMVGVKRTESDPVILENLYNQGYSIMQDNLTKLHAYLS